MAHMILSRAPGPSRGPQEHNQGHNIHFRPLLLPPALESQGSKVSTALLVPGNLPGWSLLMAEVAGQRHSLLYLRDSVSGWRFLIDTGAQISIIPATAIVSRNQPRGPPLHAANAMAIQTYGDKTVHIQIGQQNFAWRFTISSLLTAILGADFLLAHGLLVDIRGRRLVDACTFQAVHLDASRSEQLQMATISTPRDEFQQILDEFPKFLKPQLSAASLHHGVFHHIPTQVPPVHAKACRLPA
ncbi:uncharacterized protein [Narcine bancroftii]|uniref:uncharacterized protein n=1 Tax=Narcine bancroftii TaxID=1343680 RepID=UPI0038317AC1